MSFFTRPSVAKAIAKVMQGGVRAGEKRIAAQGGARLSEFPRYAEDIEIPTSFGPTGATIYRPEPGATGLPVYVNVHGGGFVLGSRVMDDPLSRAVAAEAGVIVVNVDYVLAPDHPFPQPPEHVYELLLWVGANGSEHGWDSSRLAVGGQSAGGALAAAAARLSLERGGPAISLQVLHYPPLDLTIPAGTKHSPIAKPMLKPWMGDVFDTAYAVDPATRSDRLISPAAASDTADLTGIAPALVITAENDILRDEGKRYADRLETAGALVAYYDVSGADHGYDAGDDERTRASYALIAEHVRAATTR
jgi:acetyl esterase